MKRWKLVLAVVCLVGVSAGLRAQQAESRPVYQADRQVSGTIRSWGHGFLKGMMKRWEAGFAVVQPGVRFDDTLVSSAAAMAGLYSGRADIGVLAREITPPEVAAYEKMTGQKLFPVDVLTGSLGNPDKIMALGVFVNKDNPVDQLTFEQLDAIFGAEKRRGETETIRTWGKLGAGGEWAQARIHPYSGLAFEAPGYYFSQTVMGGSVLWNCDLKQMEDLPVAGGKDLEGYQRIVDAVGADKYAIAISGAGYRNPNVKLVALAVKSGGPYVMATKQTVADRTYPLARAVRFYINAGPKLPADPKVVEFLRYALSREGQALVAGAGDFFTVPAAEALSETKRLEQALR